MPENTRMQRGNARTYRLSEELPELPERGARVKVHYAGATYSGKQVSNRGGSQTYPGYEVSGVIDKICNKSGSYLSEGARVIVYPEDEMEDITASGFSKYITVEDVNNIIPIPEGLSLQVAALLPCGALLAYTAVQRVYPFIQQKLSTANSEKPLNILIVGAGGLGLWTLKFLQYFLGTSGTNVHIAVADVSIDKLMVCKEEGCYDVVHWNDSIHEEYILERTKDVCRNGVDVALDYVSSPRTINRLTQVLKQEGVIVVGGHSKYGINICLNTLISNNHCVMGVKRGTKKQLEELVGIVAEQKVIPPQFKIFPLDQANKAFDQLKECRISARSILEIMPEDKNTH